MIYLNHITSANLEGVFEIMTKSRHRASRVLMALVPTACEKETVFANNPEITNFYKFYGGLAEAGIELPFLFFHIEKISVYYWIEMDYVLLIIVLPRMSLCM